MKVTTDTGFTCEIDAEALNDWELHEILLEDDALQDSRFARAVMEKCMTKEDAAALKDHVRTESGRIQADKLVNEVISLVGHVQKEKNSSASSAT